MSDLKNKKVELDETIASDSLHPAANAVPDPQALDSSKIGMMKAMIGMMSSMGKDDLSDMFAKVMAQFGHYADGAQDASAHNKASISMKPSHAGGPGMDRNDPMPRIGFHEDVEDMLAGQDLSEEFKGKVTTLFEAAVNARVMVEKAAIEEEYNAVLEAEVAEIAEELVDQVDSYLNYVVEQYMVENEIAIESALRNELMEDFIVGLKNLFAEHYIDVPQDKVDVMEALADKVNELEVMLNDTINENTNLKRGLVESRKAEVLEHFISGLVMTHQEKFRALAEGIEFDGDLDVYSRKLAIIKETYFQPATGESNIITESFEEPEDYKGSSNIDPSVNKYVQAISRTIKR